jgi:hypothetical protein
VVAADAVEATLRIRAAVSAMLVLMDTSISPGLIGCGIAAAHYSARDPELFGLFPATK